MAQLNGEVTVLNTMHRLAEVLNPDQIMEHLFPVVLRGANDSVPNVRCQVPCRHSFSKITRPGLSMCLRDTALFPEPDSESSACGLARFRFP